MFARVEMRVQDLSASQRFYERVLSTLGREATERDAADNPLAWADFAPAQASTEAPPTRGLHVGFSAPSRAEVDAFWEAGVRAGYRDDGMPGPRPQYVEDYYGAFSAGRRTAIRTATAWSCWPRAPDRRGPAAVGWTPTDRKSPERAGPSDHL